MMTLFSPSSPPIARVIRPAVQSAIILAVDPGTRESAFIIADSIRRVPILKGKWANETLLSHIETGEGGFAQAGEMAIELVGHFGSGMSVGKDIFETCFWIGRYIQAWKWRTKSLPTRLLRKTVVTHICGSSKAKDKNVRQALIDRYGGDDKAIGGVKCPTCKGKGVRGRQHVVCETCHGSKWKHPIGPLDGVSADIWSALAVFTTYADSRVGR